MLKLSIRYSRLSTTIYFSSMPGYVIWLRYLSWFTYTYENMIVVQWDDVEHIGE